MIICQGCGQSFPLPEGYSRNKIQCPGCGVICAVPVGREAKSGGGRKPAPAAKASAKASAPRPEPAVEDEAAKWLKETEAPPSREPVPAPLFDDEPVAPAPRAPAAKAKEM